MRRSLTPERMGFAVLLWITAYNTVLAQALSSEELHMSP